MKEVSFRIFFFFFFCVTYSRVLKSKNAAKSQLQPRFQKARLQIPLKKVYLGSFRIIGCLTYGRVFRKRGYRSPLSDMTLQIFCVCNLQPRFFKNAAIGPSEKEAHLGSFRNAASDFLCVTYSRVFQKTRLQVLYKFFGVDLQLCF